MKIWEQDGDRYYPVESGGKITWYPSVTTVLSVINKPGLNFWRGNVGNEEAEKISSEAATLGKYVHAGCKKINEGGLPDDENPQVQELLVSYWDWHNRTVDQIFHVEEPVFSKRYQFAGTPDLICKLKGDSRLTLIDIKTSKQIWLDMELQLAGYALAIEEQRAVLPEYANMRRLIVRIRKDNPSKLPEIKEYESVSHAGNAFLCALGLYRFFRPGKPETLKMENENGKHRSS